MNLGPLIDEHRITFMSFGTRDLEPRDRTSRQPSQAGAPHPCIAVRRHRRRTLEEIRKWTGTRHVCNVYGITETGSWVVGPSDADCDAEDGLIGVGWGRRDQGPAQPPTPSGPLQS
ncbi:MAG: hypothetical protein IPN98_10495 [Propionivibrio sp.]|nr:hypothetical protein [Propionivibrio sp.]